MIIISLRPDKISTDIVDTVHLRFTNTGPGICTNVRFTFRMPKEVLLIRGKRQLNISRLNEGESHEYALQVKAIAPGVFSLMSANFSYRNLAGEIFRVKETTLALNVIKPDALPSLPPPSIKINLNPDVVSSSTWTSIKGDISNTGAIMIKNVEISAEGPALKSHKEVLGDVSPGQTLPFTLSIYASEDGTRVPVCLKTRFQDVAEKFYACDSTHFIAVAKNVCHYNDRASKKGRHLKIKILFLAANPSDTTRLRLDEESRMMDRALRQAEFRDLFEIQNHWAVRVGDIQELLLRHKPDIIHFSGHGNRASEIILENTSGKSSSVSVGALSRLFSLLKDNIRCVVLNACYSEIQARAIANHIDCVIGMSDSIKDSMSISFASAFYQALAYGRNIKTAFDLGCLQINLEKLGKDDIPQLICTLTDPNDVVMVQ